ncbi:ABC transporter substrate-binding protein [Mariniluteicoccus flavus]
MKKFATVFGALAVAGAMTMSACAPGGSTDEPKQQAPEDKNLTYLYFTDGPDEQATRNLVKKFEEKSGAKVTIEIVPFANIETQLQARLAGGNAPDVARLAALTPFKNDLLDLSQTQKAALDGQFLQGADPITHNGAELIAVPSDLTMNGPMVNVEQFKKAGVEPPTKEKPWKSWDEMAEAAKKVKDANKTEYALAMDVSGHRVSTMFSQYGTTLFSADGKSVAFDPAKGAEAIKKFNDLNQSGAMPKDLFIQSGSKYKAANEIFLAQQAPVYISGNWQVAAFAKSAKFEWKAVPNPCQVECGGFPGGKFMAAFKQSKRQKLAAEFIAFMNSKESQEQMSAEANFLPTRKDLITGGVKYTSRADDMKVFLDDVSKTPEAAFASSYSPAFSAGAKSIQNELSAVLAGKGTPEGAAANIKAGAEKALKDATK